MRLRVPDGGNLFDALISPTQHIPTAPAGDVGIEDPTAEQLDAAIAQLVAGHIEYLGLHEGEAFLQVAGDGAGPYQLEHDPAPPAAARSVPDGVTDVAMRRTLHAYLARDPAWDQTLVWSPGPLGATPGRPSGGGFFKRLFGSS